MSQNDEEMLNRVAGTKHFIKTIFQRKLKNWIGYIIRGNNLIKKYGRTNTVE